MDDLGTRGAERNALNQGRHDIIARVAAVARLFLGPTLELFPKCFHERNRGRKHKRLTLSRSDLCSVLVVLVNFFFEVCRGDTKIKNNFKKKKKKISRSTFSIALGGSSADDSRFFEWFGLAQCGLTRSVIATVVAEGKHFG